MSFSADVKKGIMSKFSRHEKDTGSPEVQIALMTERIKNLTEHFKKFPKDNNSKRGLLRLIGRRKRLLRYLERVNPAAFHEIKSKLEI
ncbi:MAG: 30S ribosomal protein S15 [Brevinematia bacterium]